MPRGCASRGEASRRARERRLDSPDATRDESGRRPPRSDRARPRRFDPIATCLVPRDRFSGRRADQGARTHLLCPLPACGREGLYKIRKTRRRTRVPFVSVTRGPVRPLWRSTAVRRRFGERRSKTRSHFAGFRDCQPHAFSTEFPPSPSSSRSILKPMDGNSCAPLVSCRISRFAIRCSNSVCRFEHRSIRNFSQTRSSVLFQSSRFF